MIAHKLSLTVAAAPESDNTERYHEQHRSRTQKGEPEQMSDYRVLFIVGPGRSGSTLIGEILGQYPHVANGGELLLWWLASRSTPARRCGCGDSLTTCEFWTAVSAQHPSLTSPDPHVIDELYRARSVRHWPRLWWKSRGGRQATPEVTELITHLYDAIATVSEASVIVDSSKSPGYRLLLSGSTVHVRTLHLQRDPRSVVNSWRHEKIDALSPGDSLFAIHPLRSIFEWCAQTLAAQRFIAPRLSADDFLTLTYEEFMTAPRGRSHQIATFAEIETSTNPFHDENHASIHPTHNIAGNPDRRGDVEREILAKETWPRELPVRWTFVTTAFCAAFLPRFGYRFKARGAR